MSDPTKNPTFTIELGDKVRNLAFPIESLFAMDDSIKDITGQSIFDGYDPKKLTTRQLLEATTVFLWGGLLAETQAAREAGATEPDLTLKQVRRHVSMRNLGKLDRKVQEALKAWMPESSNPTAPAEPAKSDEPSIQ